jgi:hypothetical protein
VRPFSVSTATSHLSAVGDVVEMDEDEPAQAAARMESAHIANSRARTASSTVQAVCRCGAARSIGGRLLRAVLYAVVRRRRRAWRFLV